ncbi:MAG: HAD family hydrolase [Chloroflexaceae bacterium]|nr:HAD family hydrolase [Chloroflexaceae bacterium]
MLNLSTIRTVLFDMDGVVYRGKTLLPGVREMMEFCDQQGIGYACITNNSSRTPQQFEQKLEKMGIALPSSHIISSAQATGYYARATYPRHTPVYVIGMDGLREALFGDGYFVSDEQHPDLVVVGVDMQVTYEALKTGCLAIRRGAHFIASNTDRAFPSEEGLMPGAGALVAFIQAATDVEPFVVGKPQPTMFRVAMEVCGGCPETTLMVGDRLETDMAGAHHAGLRSVLVLTGVTRREQVETSPYPPDTVFDGLPELLAEWKQALAGG